MPPRKSKRKQAGGASTDDIPASAPMMNAEQVQNLLATGIATALSAFLATRNDNTGVSGAGGSNSTEVRHNARACSYKDFMACKPPTFKGTEGAVVLSQWTEKIETVFHLCSCPADSQVKFAACTLMGSALSWWNDHTKAMGVDMAHAIGWDTFKDLIQEEYCPRHEIQAMETELWNLKMNGLGVKTYTARFNELAALCPMMVTPENRKIERYVGGLAQPIRSLITSSRPSTFDSAKRLAYQLTKELVEGGSTAPQVMQPAGEKQTPQGRTRGNFKRQKTQAGQVAVYAATTATPGQTKPYLGTAPLCGRCNRHHSGECRLCAHCGMIGHTIEYCRKLKAAGGSTVATGANRTCFECKLPGHFKKDCPTLKGQRGRGRAFMIDAGDARQDPDVETGTFLINAIYASVLFDTGADRSFVTHKFKSLLSHVPYKQNETHFPVI